MFTHDDVVSPGGSLGSKGRGIEEMGGSLRTNRLGIQHHNARMRSVTFLFFLIHYELERLEMLVSPVWVPNSAGIGTSRVSYHH